MLVYISAKRNLLACTYYFKLIKQEQFTYRWVHTHLSVSSEQGTDKQKQYSPIYRHRIYLLSNLHTSVDIASTSSWHQPHSKDTFIFTVYKKQAKQTACRFLSKRKTYVLTTNWNTTVVSTYLQMQNIPTLCTWTHRSIQ